MVMGEIQISLPIYYMTFFDVLKVYGIILRVKVAFLFGLTYVFGQIFYKESMNFLLSRLDWESLVFY